MKKDPKVITVMSAAHTVGLSSAYRMNTSVALPRIMGINSSVTTGTYQEVKRSIVVITLREALRRDVTFCP
jgi:hypothetical protein